MAFSPELGFTVLVSAPPDPLSLSPLHQEKPLTGAWSYTAPTLAVTSLLPS